MKFVGKIICMLTLTLPLEVSAELLIFKLVEGKMALLDGGDAHNIAKIEEVLLKYQWPMVKASELTKKEQDELLTEGVPYAEERFIQKKIHEVTGNDTYQVVFIPTTIYELFVIAEIFTTKDEDNPLQNAIKKLYEYPDMQCIDISYILNRGYSYDFGKVHAEINDLYKKVNDFFYGDSSAHAYVNERLTFLLLKELLSGSSAVNAIDLSNIIQEKQEEIIGYLIEILKIMHPKFGGLKGKLTMPVKTYEGEEIKANKLVDLLIKYDDPSLKDKHTGDVVMKGIALEYEARKLNKGLLFRGSTVERFDVKGVRIDGTKEAQKYLCGTTLYIDNGLDILKMYKKKMLIPYSISFGNSLFAGVIQDFGACAYIYLNGFKSGNCSRQKNILKLTGYALFINKKASFRTDNNNLFFISPMSSLASLFEMGEFFHSRSKAAVAIKNKEQICIIGLALEIEDPAGIIIVEREDLEHAAMVSDFLEKNGRIIQIGDEENLTPEEKQFVEDVMKNQKDASAYYRGIKIVTPWVSEVTKKWHENPEWKAKIIQQMKNAKKQKRAEKEALKQEVESKAVAIP